MTNPATEGGSNGARHGPRYIGETSKRWPAGRPLCGGDRGTDADTGEHKGHCRKTAGTKTDHFGTGACDNHGGCTPSHKVAAEKELARRAVATFGLPVEIDPHTAVLGEVYRTAGAVAWLDSVVRALDSDAAVWGVVEDSDKSGLVSKAGVNVWVDLWQRERRHLVAVCKAAADMRIDERLVRLAEAQGAQLAAVIREFAARLGLSADQEARVPEALSAAVAALGAPVIEGRAA